MKKVISIALISCIAFSSVTSFACSGHKHHKATTTTTVKSTNDIK